MQAFSGLHSSFEQRDYEARSRRLAAERAHEMANAKPSTRLGHGRLATLADAARADLFNPRGLFLGTLGGRPLFYSGDAHILTYGRTGTGKGVTAILPNLAHSRDRSLVVVDVKDGENAFASHKHRADTLHHTCVYLNPFGLQGLPNTKINPLQLLRDVVERHGEIDTEADGFAHILVPMGKNESDNNAWPKKGARRLLAVIMEYLAHYEPERCSLGGLWAVLNSSDDELSHTFACMQVCERRGIEGRAAQLWAVKSTAEEQWEAYRSEAIDALAPFEPGKTLERTTSGHDFDFSLLKVQPTTVYLIAPSEKLSVVAPWISLIVNYAIETIAKQAGPVRTTFLLDEFPQLPPAPAIIKALQLYRGKGISLWFFAQGRYSIEGRWPKEAAMEIEDQADILQTWSVEDRNLIGDITLWSGTQTISAPDMSHSGGTVESANASLREAKRPVLQAEDIRGIGKDGRQILKVSGHPYLIVGERVPYFEVDPWKDQLRDVRLLHAGLAV